MDGIKIDLGGHTYIHRRFAFPFFLVLLFLLFLFYSRIPLALSCIVLLHLSVTAYLYRSDYDHNMYTIMILRLIYQGRFTYWYNCTTTKTATHLPLTGQLEWIRVRAGILGSAHSNLKLK